MLTHTTKHSMQKQTLLRLLDEIEHLHPSNGVTLYFPPEYPNGSTDILLTVPISWRDDVTKTLEHVTKSDTGGVLFWSQNLQYIIFPPFPLNVTAFYIDWNVSHLRDLMNKEYTLGVVFVRLGRYAIGVFQGDALISSKTAGRYVKGRHKAGGTSQKRFERIREGQIARLYQKVCSIVQEKFSPIEHQLDYIFLGGERFTLRKFVAKCPYLQKLSAKLLERLLAVTEPNQQSLLRTPKEVWKSLVIMICNQTDQINSNITRPLLLPNHAPDKIDRTN